MTASAPPFAFPSDTLDFLDELGSHNTRAWFDANRARHQAAYVEAAKAFIEAVTPILEAIIPGIHAEPACSGPSSGSTATPASAPTSARTRTTWTCGSGKGTGRRPSGLFARVSPELVGVGAGSHGLDKSALASNLRPTA